MSQIIPAAEVPAGFTRIPNGLPSAGLLVTDLNLPVASYLDALHRHGFLLFRGLEQLSAPQVVAFVREKFPDLKPRNLAGDGRTNIVAEAPQLAMLGSIKNPTTGGFTVDFVPASYLNAPLLGCSMEEMDRGLTKWLDIQEESGLAEWHQDQLFTPVPPTYNALFCRQAGGSATGFADAVRGFELLDEPLKASVTGLKCKYRPSIVYGNRELGIPTVPTRRQQQSVSGGLLEAEDVVGVETRLLEVAKRSADTTKYTDKNGNPVNDPWYRVPLIQPHPVTSEPSIILETKSLETLTTDRGSDLPVREGQRLAWQVLRRATQEDNAYKYFWKEGDLIVWDQRRTFHARVPYDADHNDRLMWRMDFERDAATRAFPTELSTGAPGGLDPRYGAALKKVAAEPAAKL